MGCFGALLILMLNVCFYLYFQFICVLRSIFGKSFRVRCWIFVMHSEALIFCKRMILVRFVILVLNWRSACL